MAGRMNGNALFKIKLLRTILRKAFDAHLMYSKLRIMHVVLALLYFVSVTDWSILILYFDVP